MTDPDQRCPHCAALVRHGTAWCTLCHADLRPAAEPVDGLGSDDIVIHGLEGRDGLDGVGGLDEEPAGRTLVSAGGARTVVSSGGRHAKHGKRAATTPTAVFDEDDFVGPYDAVPEFRADDAAALDDLFEAEPVDGDEVLDDPEIMFALLRGETRDPRLQKLQSSLSEPSTRIAVIIGGALAIGVLMFGVVTLLGFFIH